MDPKLSLRQTKDLNYVGREGEHDNYLAQEVRSINEIDAFYDEYGLSIGFGNSFQGTFLEIGQPNAACKDCEFKDFWICCNSKPTKTWHFNYDVESLVGLYGKFGVDGGISQLGWIKMNRRT